MLKVLKNLKNSFWKVLAIVLLLCLQASADLKLPDYTSKIVNTGIQSNGIEVAVPEVISKEDMDNILLFTNQDEKIIEQYSSIENEKDLTKDEKRIVKKYFGNNNNFDVSSVYILKNIKDDNIKELENIISTPLMVVTTIRNEEISNQIKEKMTENIIITKEEKARKFTRKPETIYLFSKFI